MASVVELAAVIVIVVFVIGTVFEVIFTVVAGVAAEENVSVSGGLPLSVTSQPAP